MAKPKRSKSAGSMFVSAKALDDPRLGLSDDALNNVGRAIRQCIEHWESSFAPMKQRIKENERLYANSPDSTTPAKGSRIAVHIPIIKPRLSQRRSSVSQAVFANEPWFVVHGSNESENAKLVEDAIQFSLENIGFKSTLGQALKIAYRSQAAVLRVGYFHSPEGLPRASTTGEFSGPVIDIIHPMDFVVYPYNSDLDQARCHGHRFDILHSDLVEKMESGDWIESDIPSIQSSISDAQRSNTTYVDMTTVAHSSDAPQKMYDVLYRTNTLSKDKVSRTYRVIMHWETMKVVHIKPYSPPLSWYVPMSVESDPNKIIPDESPVQDLQGLQKLLNRVFGSFLDGSEMSARPPILASTSVLGKKLQGYSPGEIIPMDRAPDARPMPISFNPTAYPDIISLLRQMADSNGRVADTMTGAPSSSRESTATEQNIKMQAFQVAGNDDIENITSALLRIAKLVHYYLGTYYKYWASIYTHLDIHDDAPFKANVTIKLAATSTSNAPVLQLQFAQQLLQIMQEIPELQAIKPQMLITVLENSPLQDKQELIDQLKEMSAIGQNVGIGHLSQMGVQPQDAAMMALEALKQQNGNPTTTDSSIDIPGGNATEGGSPLDHTQVMLGIMAAEALAGGRIETTTNY